MRDPLKSEIIKKFQKYLIDSIQEQRKEGEINKNLEKHWLALAEASHDLEHIFMLAADIGWSLPLTLQVFFMSAGESPNCNILLRCNTWYKEDPE